MHLTRSRTIYPETQTKRNDFNTNYPRSINYFSLTVSGTLLVQKGEFLSLSVFSSGDSNYEIHSQSDFSCHQLTESHGFHAVKAGRQDIGDGWTRVTSWRAQGKPGLYSVGGGFNVKPGIFQNVFRASKNGAYYCAVQVRIDRASIEEGADIVSYIRLQLRVDEETDDSLSTVEGNGISNNHGSLNVANTLALKKGQIVSAWVYSSVAAQINSESGFSCHLIGTHKGFHATLGQDTQYGTGWSTVKGWRTWGTSVNYGWGGRPSADGFYKAPKPGYYTCAAQVRRTFPFLQL